MYHWLLSCFIPSILRRHALTIDLYLACWKSNFRAFLDMQIPTTYITRHRDAICFFLLVWPQQVSYISGQATTSPPLPRSVPRATPRHAWMKAPLGLVTTRKIMFFRKGNPNWFPPPRSCWLRERIRKSCLFVFWFSRITFLPDQSFLYIEWQKVDRMGYHHPAEVHGYTIKIWFKHYMAVWIALYMGILEHPGMPRGGWNVFCAVWPAWNSPFSWWNSGESLTCRMPGKTLHLTAKHVILKHWLQGDQLWGMITYPDGIWSPNHYRHSENYGHTLDTGQMWISQCCHPTIWMVWSVELTNVMVSLFDIDRIWKFMPFNGRFQIFVNSFIFPSSNLYPTASTGAFVELPVGPGGSLLRHYRNAWDGWRWLTYVVKDSALQDVVKSKFELVLMGYYNNFEVQWVEVRVLRMYQP